MLASHLRSCRTPGVVAAGTEDGDGEPVPAHASCLYEAGVASVG